MPLLDHFHPPLSMERPWEGIHSTWASTIATQLHQDQLPAEYFAMPLITLGGGVQVDVGTFQTSEQPESANGEVVTQNASVCTVGMRRTREVTSARAVMTVMDSSVVSQWFEAPPNPRHLAIARRKSSPMCSARIATWRL